MSNAHRLIKAGKENHRLLVVGWGDYPSELEGEVVHEETDEG